MKAWRALNVGCNPAAREWLDRAEAIVPRVADPEEKAILNGDLADTRRLIEAYPRGS